MAKDPGTYFRNTLGALSGAIRMADFKANVAIVFVAIMMGPVLAARDKFPPFFTLAVVMAPFLIIYFCLLLCLMPRYPGKGAERLLIRRNPDPSIFLLPDDEQTELNRLQTLCAVFSQILYWKTVLLYISFYTAIFSVALIAMLMGWAWLPFNVLG